MVKHQAVGRPSSKGKQPQQHPSPVVPQSLFRHGPLGITIKQKQWLAGGQAAQKAIGASRQKLLTL
jgi:hypothetical protein